MKKYLIFTFGAFLMISGFVFAHPAHATVGYSYYRAITVTSSTSIASGTNLSFPMLFSGTYPWLEASTTGGGSGRIQNLTTAPNGSQEAADLIFTTSTPTASGSAWNCGTSLNFETESYVSSTGVISDWVNVPSLAAGQVIYACYGSTGVTGDQSHPSSTWNSNYLAVWHMGDNAANTTIFDSTANNRNGTAQANTSAKNVVGEIGNAQTLNGSSDYIKSADYGAPMSFTIEAWGKPSGAGNVFSEQGQSTVDGGWYDSQLEIESNSVVNSCVWAGSLSCVTATSSLAYNTWHLFATRYNLATTKLSGIIDGVVGASNSSVNRQNPGDTYWDVGYNTNTNDGNTSKFSGPIDEVRVSNVALSDGWLATEYNNQNSPSTFYAVGSEQTGSGGSSPTISSFAASPTTVATNGTSTLSWSVTGATSLSISPTIGTVTGTSTTTPALSTSTIYTLSATNASGTSTATTSVSVTGGGGGGTNISSLSTQHWAWNDEIGWMDFYDTLNVTVSSSNLIGYASSSAGYISLDCGTSPNGNICGTSDYGISNDGSGNLAGWAWNDLYGWISFCGNSSGGGSTWTGTSWICPSSPTYRVVISPSTGIFSGWAWNDTVGWISFNCSNTSNCGSPSQYDVATSWMVSGTSTMGMLDSETFDTGVASGAELNSVTWQGSAPSQTSVSFQFAVSSSTSGPWNFVGPDGTSATSYLGVAGVPIALSNYSSLTGRYFRYRVILTTDPTGTATPRVQGVVVDWSP